MLPKSSKHYIVPTAETLGIPTTVIEDVVGFYYSQVRDRLTKMSHHNITIDNLGSFQMSTKKLAHLKEKYKVILKKNVGDTFTQMAIRKETQIKFERVLRIQEVMQKEYERKREFLDKKYAK